MVIDSYVDCVPCIVKMADKIANRYLKTKKEKFTFMKEVLKIIDNTPYEKTAPYLSGKIMSLAKEITGIDDLYKKEREKFNTEIYNLLPNFRRYALDSNDPIKKALQLSMAGNIIDSGIIEDISIDLVSRVIDEINDDKFNDELYRKFIDDLENRKHLLYLGDNTGEIVFDRLLIEMITEKYKNLKVTFVTRGDYIINDVIESDAYDIGLDKFASIINNGAAIPGTDLTQVSEKFKKLFDKSDFIISKGQGNFESLPGTSKNIYYLFLCKCELLQKQLNRKKLDHVFIHEKSIINYFKGEEYAKSSSAVL